MNKTEMLNLLNSVKNNTISPEEAVLKFKKAPFEDLGFANVDHHRGLRQGTAEVIYGAGKTALQIKDIASCMLNSDERSILITRLSSDSADFLAKNFDFEYYEIAKIGVINRDKNKILQGNIVIASGGTSDMPISEEAALTSEILGSQVTRLYDVGVSGLHRLLSHLDVLMSANVVIAVAGMEGALASVVGGLCDCPVIAVPTSVGYGANFGGLSALLSMLNSCASGVSVVNIDNGFGAGYLANMINCIGRKS